MSHKNIPLKSIYGFTSDAVIENTNKDCNVIPGGTTLDRPLVPKENSFRINTDTNNIEYFVNGEWRTNTASVDLQDLEDLSFVYALMLSE